MSSQITLNTWSGESKKAAAAELSKVFRLDQENGLEVMESLCQGVPWRFHHTISGSQASVASKYLRSLGFSVDIQSVTNGVEPLPEPETTPEEKTEVPSLPDNASSHRMGFQGDGRTLFGIHFSNLIKTVVTLGIYRFWAKTKVRQYLWSQTLFAGDRLSYHGTAKELLRGAVRFGLIILFVIAVNSYAYFMLGETEGELVGNILTVLITLAIPFLMVGAWRYRLSRTAWRGIRFSFRGNGREALSIYFKGYFFVPLTLGLYWPFFTMENEKFWRENSWFGDMQMRFSGKGKDFLKKFILALFLTPLTLGFYMFWFIADLSRYIWSHTHIGGATFHFPIKGRDYMNLKVTNFFLLLFTLGLGYSWVVVRNRKFIADHLTLAGNIELNRVVQEMKDSGAFGEEGMDLMDVPIDIG
ncbi:MAG: YjgN family protein [Nitrospinota bacterium]